MGKYLVQALKNKYSQKPSLLQNLQTAIFQVKTAFLKFRPWADPGRLTSTEHHLVIFIMAKTQLKHIGNCYKDFST